MGVQITQGWITIVLAVHSAIFMVVSIGLGILLWRGRQKKPAGDLKGAIVAAACAAATGAATRALQAGGDNSKVAEAVRDGIAAGRMEGRVHAGLPRHRRVSVEEAAARGGEARNEAQHWAEEQSGDREEYARRDDQAVEGRCLSKERG